MGSLTTNYSNCFPSVATIDSVQLDRSAMLGLSALNRIHYKSVKIYRQKKGSLNSIASLQLSLI